MKAKLIVLFFALMLAPQTAVSFAQSTGDTNSPESINLADVPDESIVVLSKQESGIPGYVFVKYAFVHSDCSGGYQLIEHYGAPFDVNDPTIRRAERKYCSQAGDERDGE
jgi:hypothetical protein